MIRLLLKYRVTMRQGLIQLSLLGLLFALETAIAPGPGFSRGRAALVFFQQAFFVLLCLTLLISVIQRIALIWRASSPGEMIRKIGTAPHAPFLVLHVGLLLLIAAFAYSKTGGIEALMELPVGGESRTVQLADGRRLDLPFTVRATGFEMERYPSGEVRQFVGKLELDGGDGFVEKREITVGEPLIHAGYRFSLFQYGDRGSRVKGGIRDIKNPSYARPFDALSGGTVLLPDDSFAALVSLEEHATRRTPAGYRDVGHALHYKVLGRDGESYEMVSYQSAAHVIDWRRAGEGEYVSVHLLRDSVEANRPPVDYYFTVSDISPKKTVGFQVRYYPGLNFLLIASFLVVAGTTWEILIWRPQDKRSSRSLASGKAEEAEIQKAESRMATLKNMLPVLRREKEDPCST